jgi:thiamine-phosphate pyrophosphorylase
VRLPPAIVALTPGDVTPERAPELERRIVVAVEAGLSGVLLREPALADGALLELARTVRLRFPRAGRLWLCVHDRPHLAEAARADAVHLGGNSLPPAVVRAWLARDVALGLSTHAGDDARTFEAADYRVHGPVFDTQKHGQAVRGIGLESLAAAVRSSDRPLWALGGLRPVHARDVRAAGARGMAVLSGLLAHADVAGRAREYVEAWEHAAAP